MKNLLFLFLLASFTSLMVTSCSKENIIEPTTTVDPVEPEVTHTANALMTRSANESNELGLELDCITVSFPFNLVDDQGVQYTIDGNQAFVDLMNTTTEVVIIDFVYPLNVLHEDGNTTQVSDAMELGELFAECIPNGGWTEEFFPAYLIDFENSCLSIQYPVQLEDEAGNTVSAANEEALIALLANQPYAFIFPLDLADEDGEVFTANDIDELFTLLLSCNDFEYDTTYYDWETGFEYYACYTINFPLDVTLQDGTVVTVNNHMELCDLMMTGSITGYAFPLTLVREDGTTLVVNNQVELDAAVAECPDIDVTGWSDAFLLLIAADLEGNGSGCYTINYPITLNNNFVSNPPLTVNSNEEFISAFENADYDLQYPVSVNMVSTGATVNINSFEELDQLLIDCQ